MVGTGQSSRVKPPTRQAYGFPVVAGEPARHPRFNGSTNPGLSPAEPEPP